MTIETKPTDYILQLKERRPEIADFLARCESNHLAQEDLRAMRNCIRALLKLTEAHSDSQMQKLAEAMREAIEPEISVAHIDLISLARTLLGACNETLATTHTGTLKLPAFSPPSSAGSNRKPVLLTVDDDRIIRTMIDAMFGDHATVLAAENGRQGLELMRSHRPDIVLLDDAMPEITGLKLIESLRDEPALAGIAVIMLTSSDRPQDIQRAMTAGARDYVIKPFDPAVLAEKVYRVLGENRA